MPKDNPKKSEESQNGAKKEPKGAKRNLNKKLNRGQRDQKGTQRAQIWSWRMRNQISTSPSFIELFGLKAWLYLHAPGRISIERPALFPITYCDTSSLTCNVLFNMQNSKCTKTRLTNAKVTREANLLRLGIVTYECTLAEGHTWSSQVTLDVLVISARNPWMSLYT